MEAKDTVMNQRQFEKAEKKGKWKNDMTPVLELQAELSFQAGKEAERERILALLLDKDWGVMCADNDDACPACKHFYKGLKEEK